MARGLFVFLVGVVAATALGCGGGGGDDGGGGPSADFETEVLYSTPALDGYVNTPPGNVASTGNGIDVGDEDGLINGNFRNGFLSFDLTLLPAGIEVGRATLRCFHNEVQGSPYLELGQIVVDHVDYGPTLDNGDYNLASIVADIGAFPPDTGRGWRNLSVTDAVRAAHMAGAPRCQFRLRFSLEPPGDGMHDYVTFEDGDTTQGTGNRPELVVDWWP